jgi:hypothetical protein
METLFVYIVASLHKSIVTSASIVMRTLLFPLLSDLSRCYGILVCHNIVQTADIRINIFFTHVGPDTVERTTNSKDTPYQNYK